MTNTAKIGIIGGSGLYELGLLDRACAVSLHTPYGPHSTGFSVGAICETPVAFVPRHGLGHSIPPHRVPYRANLWALHALGVRRILTVSAMGGTRTHFRIGDVCVPDQIVDWTKGRPSTFFDGPQVVHTPFSEPFCPRLRRRLVDAGRHTSGVRVHENGTVLVFDGPRFSTRAESLLFREVIGADLLSMTAMPEAILARELGICYATVAVISDLDAFGDEPVCAEDVNAVMRKSYPALADVLRRAIAACSPDEPCTTCADPAHT